MNKKEVIEYIVAADYDIKTANDMVRGLPESFGITDPTISCELCDIIVDGMIQTMENLEWQMAEENRNRTIYRVTRAYTEGE